MENMVSLKVGSLASFQKTITEADIHSFAGITGDFNPVHINK
jgi:3-hydroxybutyryl-CoA dehydratase